MQQDTSHWGQSPIMAIETRPSTLTGIAWFIVLSYVDRAGHEHRFERQLPQEWASWDDASRDLALLPYAEQLRALLAPILIREDGEHLQLVKP
jgi:hypothetical protein